MFTNPSLRLGYSVFFKAIDKGIIELLGPTGIANITFQLSKKVKAIQTGYIHDYLTLMVLAIGFFIYI